MLPKTGQPASGPSPDAWLAPQAATAIALPFANANAVSNVQNSLFKLAWHIQHAGCLPAFQPLPRERPAVPVSAIPSWRPSRIGQGASDEEDRNILSRVVAGYGIEAKSIRQSRTFADAVSRH